MKQIFVLAAALMVSMGAAAQPGGERGDFPGPPGGGPGMGQGGRPPMMSGEVDIEALEKYNAKQDKKLKKILGEDLHAMWRAHHPVEAPKLPDVKF